MPRQFSFLLYLSVIFTVVLSAPGCVGDLPRLIITTDNGDAAQVTATARPTRSSTQPSAAAKAPPAVTPEAALARTLPSLEPPLPPARKDDTESGAITRVAQAVRPAVVNITTQQIAYDFYMRPVPEESGTGSGVIFDKDGYILTNNHVVENSQGLKVTLPDGRTSDGKIIGTDARSDLAVIKITGEDLPTAELGDSDALQIGETVIAIGNALSLSGGPTVTAGIVGALGRTIRESNGAVLYDLIQTDAAINPGNSGGPLIDLRGRVVGINTAIAASAPGGGIGFAIAINSARPIAKQLLAQGRVVRPWLGVTLQNITPGLAARYNLPVSKGALVYSFQRNTPAARAGLRRGDIIIRLGEDEVQDDASLLKAMSKRRIGETVTLVVVRDAQRISLDIILEEMPANAQ
ncbi:MAG: trypsin-like peptidase domain-containing protein [Chloroflexi bacterium]|nr:trypsin-like peptidase domain-containing protein [Chloroflexota bacterium]